MLALWWARAIILFQSVAAVGYSVLQIMHGQRLAAHSQPPTVVYA